MMAADLTSRLPRERGRVQMARQQWRLSVGMKTGSGRDTRTSNLGYWILKLRRRERGAEVIYERDEFTQTRLQKMTNDPQPKVIPCSVIGNPIPDDLNPGKQTLPDTIIFREIARFGSGRRLCYCQNPEAPRPIAHCAQQEKAQGKNGEYLKIVGWQEKPCTANDTDQPCPYFNSDKPTCKPHVKVPLYLPWSGNTGAAMYHTTGWYAFNSMMDSLLEVAAITGGWLHGLPLEFVYEETQTPKGFWVPAPRFRLVTEGPKAALKAAQELKLLKAGDVPPDQVESEAARVVNAEAEPVREVLAASLEDEDEQRETQEEFYPGATADVVDAEFETQPPHPTGTTSPLMEPVAEAEGDDFALQSPPDHPRPSQIETIEQFNAAIQGVGIKTPRQLEDLKKNLGLGDVKRKDMTVVQLQQVYTRALSDWEAAHG